MRAGGLHLLASGLVFVSAVPAQAGTAEQFAQGRQLFLTGAAPACSLCHTLKEAGSEGAVGPVLDEIKPDATRVANALRNGLGSMPSYRATLTAGQIEALAHYVSRASGGAAGP